VSADRIVVGVDGSPEGFVALEQAVRLLDGGGELVALVVCQEQLAVHAGLEAPRLADELHAEAEVAAAHAESGLRGLAGAHVELAHGRALTALADRAASLRADVIAVGSHSHSRAAGIVLGSVATALLHESRASVLVARAAASGTFPARIVAGTDGSRDAQAAVRVARELAQRLGTPLRLLVADGGKPPHRDGLEGLDGLEHDERQPVDALVAAGDPGDLIVVGSRGHHGVGALGSVSERVAHRAACSVLVVRCDPSENV
jgi:nucleotide-binding universal stress UspA family protein